ncbi:MAG: site-specific DNA-methyltransferase [Bacteroidaceae bacterium]|nr:site-specific DNA-methyltransferase [Bacteroidaceae bacterium]
MDKQRAGRNRTITITAEERSELKKGIATAQSFDTVRWKDTIVCADLLSIIDRIPDGVADLIIIDPPYNLSKDFNGLAFSAISSEKYADYLRSWFHKVCDKLKPNGSLYMCGDWKCTSTLQTVIEERLTIINRITWQREKGRGARANWKNCMEDIWFAVNNPHDYYFDVESVKIKRHVRAPYKVGGQPKDWEATEEGNYRLTYPSNFWDDISIPFWSMPENTDHPTQKPEKLYAKLILASSCEGDVVFDPFMGSGTAAVVAKKLRRKYLGIEINEEYCLWAAKRLRMADENAEIQGYTDGVFWERNSQNKQIKGDKNSG